MIGCMDIGLATLQDMLGPGRKCKDVWILGWYIMWIGEYFFPCRRFGPPTFVPLLWDKIDKLTEQSIHITIVIFRGYYLFIMKYSWNMDWVKQDKIQIAH
eukprot:UN26488